MSMPRHNSGSTLRLEKEGDPDLQAVRNIRAVTYHVVGKLTMGGLHRERGVPPEEASYDAGLYCGKGPSGSFIQRLFNNTQTLLHLFNAHQIGGRGNRR